MEVWTALEPQPSTLSVVKKSSVLGVKLTALHRCHPVYLSRLMIKPTKWLCNPVKVQVSLGVHPVWSESLLSAWREFGVLSYPLSAQRRLWSDWADAQADLSLRWVHSHSVGFVMRRLIFSCVFQGRCCLLFIWWSCKLNVIQAFV